MPPNATIAQLYYPNSTTATCMFFAFSNISVNGEEGSNFHEVVMERISLIEPMQEPTWAI